MERYLKFMAVALTVPLVVTLAGCPPPPQDSTRVITLLSRDTDKAGPVDEDDILSLVVQIDEITLDASGGSGDDPETTVVVIQDNTFVPANVTIEEGDTVQWLATTDTFHTVTSGLNPADPDAGEAFDFAFDEDGQTASVEFAEIAFNTGSGQTTLIRTDDDGDESTETDPPFDVDSGDAVFPYFCLPHVNIGMVGEVRVTPASTGGDSEVIFTGPVDVDLMELGQLNTILSSAPVEPGSYSKIRLVISNPRLTLADDPGTVHTNVQLTANGRLFISEQVQVAEGEDQVLVLSFQGLHLVEKGNGDFVLTPQLRADVDLTTAPAMADGTIESIDIAANTLVLQLDDGELTVSYDLDTAIFLPTDGETPTGTEVALVVGADVQVQGTLSDGELAATTIIIF